MLPVSEKGILKLVKLMRDQNVFPIFLDRYADQRSKNPINELFHNLTEEALDLLSVSSGVELGAYREGLNSFWRHQISKDLLTARDTLTIKALAEFLIIDITQQIYNDLEPYLRNDYFDKSIVFEIYPELKDLHDDEGMLILDSPDLRLEEWGVIYKNHVLQYHQLLRRSFFSNPNFDFIRRLIAFKANNPTQRVVIAIDHTRLMPLEYYIRVSEKDHWYGPPLKWEELDNPFAVGLTVHHQEPETFGSISDSLDRTEFYWSFRDTLKTFQVEEVHTISEGQIHKYVLNRYVHSQRDTSKKNFIHLDGAVKVYEQFQYPQRYNETMPDVLRVKHKIKLFRVDGEIQEAKWSDLVSFFFRGNEMVLEYLDSEWKRK